MNHFVPRGFRRPCERCGEPVKRSAKRFCSMECFSPPKNIIQCRNCGCDVSDRPEESSVRRVFCGAECRRAFFLVNRPSKTVEYTAWQSMKRRCGSETGRDFRNYKSRGIRVCPEWEHDFPAFLKHVGLKPTPKHSLDRIDNDGNYEPGNVRSSTNIEQCSNTSRSRLYEYSGEKVTLPELYRRFGIKVGTLDSRMKRKGWSLEKALEMPLYATYGDGPGRPRL